MKQMLWRDIVCWFASLSTIDSLPDSHITVQKHSIEP